MARDIFGEENYILNASEIDSADTLINGFKNVFDNREQISDQLGQVIPDIRRRSFAAGEKLCEMLK